MSFKKARKMTALTKVPIPTLEHVQSSGLASDKLKLG